MVLDPLGARPIVITGSANFSDASSSKNDENMLVLVDDPDVADKDYYGAGFKSRQRAYFANGPFGPA